MNQTNLITNQISLVSFGYEYNYISMFGSDGQKLNLTLRQNETVEYLKRFGGQVIVIQCDYTQHDNETDKIKYLKRIAKVAKSAGYKNNVKLVDEYEQRDGIKKEWTSIKGQFIKE